MSGWRWPCRPTSWSNRVLRSVKNFAALFVASGFLAGLFLQLAGSVQQTTGGQFRGP